MERRQLLSALTVTDTADDANPGSLRWAIDQANSSPTGASVEIDFDIPDGGPLTIHLSSPLPVIQVPLTVDGTTEPGYSGSPLVEVDGSGLAGTAVDGLVVTAGNSTIRGLSLVGFSGSAIVLESGNANVVAANYVGLTPSGTLAAPNQQGITLLGSSYNTIGVGTAGLGNVISGNAGDGILVEPGDGTNSAANQVVGNEIGTSPDGLHAIGNGGSGIVVDGDGAGGNMLGMPGLGFGNVVSGNQGPAIIVNGGAHGTEIQNDLIGVGIDGKTPLGNQGDGVQLDDAPGTLIGGPDPGERNVIAANRGNGIATSDDTTGLVVAGNSIGTDTSGVLQLGNQQNGICLASSNNTIGGTDGGATNFIEFNGSGRVGAGVQLVGPVTENTILSNSIAANAGLGINFGSGPTPNHAPGTPGPNDYQNYPVLSVAQDNGVATTVDGTLFESPNTTYVVQFFSSPQPDPSGYGQGKTFLGSTNVQTDSQGSATFTTGLPPAGAAGMYLSATATDPSGNTSEFSGDIAVQGQINLVVTGVASPNPVLDGASLTYTLTVNNLGTAVAHDVIFQDQLPSSVTLQGITPSQGFVIPEAGGGAPEVDLGTIPAGTSATVIITVQTGVSSVGTITDTASVSSEEPDPNQAAESTTIPVVVETAADVSISLAEGPSPALAGDDLMYTMTVSNLGPQGASNVIASLPMASGLDFVSASSAVGSVSVVAGQAVASLGNLASGAQDVVTIVVQATAAGSVTETASVTSDSLDPDLANNTSAPVTTAVAPASDLEVQIAADTTVAATGMPFDYTVTATNNGPSDDTAVVLSDSLPAGVTFVSATTDSGAIPTLANGVVTVQLAILPAGSTATLTIAVNPTAQPGATLVDTATVQGAQDDPDLDNNSDSLSLPVRGLSDLSVVATVQPGSGYVGQPVTYSIAVTNNGPLDEPDAVLSSALAAGLVVDSTSSTAGADPPVSQGIMTADLGPLLSGQTDIVTLVVTPGQPNVGMLTTGFSVQGQDYDPDPSNNAVSVSLPIAPSCDLGVAIAPGNVAAVSQVDWAYTVQVTNAGPSPATGVAATIPLPAGAQFVSASSSQGLAPVGQDGALVAALGTIASGGSATVTILIEPDESVAGGTLTLAAQVAGSQYDPDLSDNQTSLNLAVAPSVNLAVSLTSTPQVIPSGQVVTFTALVSNLGPTPATGVVVAFPSVSGMTFVGSSPSQGSPTLVAGQFLAQLGSLAPGASATVTVSELATTPGLYTMTASLSQAEFNVNVPGGSATAAAQVVESPGMIEFGAGSYEVTDQSGVATISVVRLFGASGTIAVHYQTSPINATPGLDFTPTSGTLTLGPGQWTASIQVPVLDDRYLNHDTYLDVTLDSPTGGAYLGPPTTALLHIQDVDPDVTPPQVSGLTWSGSAQAITGLTLQFTAPMDPAFVTDADDYHLIRLSGGQPIAISTIQYNPTNFTVTIVPQSPLASDQYYQVELVGTGASALRDVADNALDGAGNGLPGSDYSAVFAQGTRLKYVDHNHNTVTLAVNGPGYLQQVLDSQGDGLLLNLVGMEPHRTTLRGRIKPHKGGIGQVQIGQITGLGQFGDVRILMKTPPFRVTQLPFQRRGKFVL
jgi:uncharacterized repeat protein (TIGR01451 family)